MLVYNFPQYIFTRRQLENYDDQKDRYHKENMLAAKLVLVNIDQMPVTHKDLKDWVLKKQVFKLFRIY